MLRSYVSEVNYGEFMKFRTTTFLAGTLFTVLSSLALHSVTLASDGTVTFQVKTISYGGKYSEKNIGAIWVEDSQGQFVKTLKVWAKKRKQHLIKWGAVSNENDVDAITSATIRSHEIHSVTWDCTDTDSSNVPDGPYKIYVEFTEDNSNKDGQPPGKWTVVEFAKGAAPQNINPPDETYFQNVELVYTISSIASASISGTVKDEQTNATLENATIQLKLGNDTVYEINSDAAGFYIINDVQPGNYTLVAFKPGYVALNEEVTLNSGEQLTKDVGMTPEADTAPPSPPKM